jgi:hypothetical protein
MPENQPPHTRAASPIRLEFSDADAGLTPTMPLFRAGFEEHDADSREARVPLFPKANVRSRPS